MKTKKRMPALLLTLVLLVGMTPVRAEAAGQKLAAITFDDGPGPYTDNLLDELAKRNVPVTFFMQGYRAAQYPAVVKKAYEAGHQIASHTYDHPSLTKIGDKAIQKQVSTTAAILNQAVGGNYSYMVRPPYGSVNARVLKALNVPAVLWSVDTLDWKSLNADAVCQHILNDTKDGSIILLHDIHATSIPGALRGIDALRSQGYELVTVSELLRRRGKEAVPGTKYFSAYGTSTLPGISKPAIVPTETENGRVITLTADAGTKIYYTTDGAHIQEPRLYRPVSVGESRDGKGIRGAESERRAQSGFNAEPGGIPSQSAGNDAAKRSDNAVRQRGDALYTGWFRPNGKFAPLYQPHSDSREYRNQGGCHTT